MDIRVTQILSQSAGTYFIVTSKQTAPPVVADAKTRLIFVNTEKGMVNTIYNFSKGDTTGFTSIFGTAPRLKEKKGNFSISTCLDALKGGPIAVMNLRSFDDSVDKAGIIGLNPNINPEYDDTVAFTSLFNTNALWTPKPKNIPVNFQAASLLNFGNIGSNDLTIFVVKSTDAEVLSLTNEGEKTLSTTVLEIEDFPALKSEMLVKDTFVTVYIFNNNFDPSTVSSNKYYGQLFDNTGNLISGGLPTLQQIAESGFVTKYSGSLIPNLVSEKSAQISVDAIVNQNFVTTGIISFINDELFEENNTDLLDIFGTSFFDGTTLKPNVSTKLLSYNVPSTLSQAVATYPLTAKSQDVNPVQNNLITYGATKVDSTNFIGSFGQGLRVGDKLKGVDGIVNIIGITILDEAAVIGSTTDTYRKVKYTTDGAIDYAETVVPEVPEIPAISEIIDVNLGFTTTEITANGNLILNVTGSDAQLPYSINIPLLIGDDNGGDGNNNIVLKIESAITADSYLNSLFDLNGFNNNGNSHINFTCNPGQNKVDNISLISDGNLLGFTDAPTSTISTQGANLVPTVPAHSLFALIKENLFITTATLKPWLIESYKPRTAQFTDGTASKQNEILDMMNNPGIVKGLKSFKGLRYVIDAFKSFIEPNYKYQFGILMDTLDAGNRFVRAAINEPFLEDLQNSTNPLFKAAPGNQNVFDWTYVKTGGNTQYSSVFLTKFTVGSDLCFFFGPGNKVTETLTRPLAGLISNLFYAKKYDFDVVANASGYVDGITALEEPAIDDTDRASCEAFNYNPVIYLNSAYTIYGNKSGTKLPIANQQIHNSELLAFIKGSLYNMTTNEAFKKGNYDDYLRVETETKDFMTNLALLGAIEANPIVICNASNNDSETKKAKIKLVYVEYTAVNALEKTIFELQID